VEPRAVDGVADEDELLPGRGEALAISPRTISELQMTALSRGEVKSSRSAASR
jgi:hypothetical protein